MPFCTCSVPGHFVLLLDLQYCSALDPTFVIRGSIHIPQCKSRTTFLNIAVKCDASLLNGLERRARALGD